MDIIVVGFALFSLFFGAGNLIFPPLLGKAYQSNWIISSLGFILTGVGLASLAVISMAKKNGDVKEFTKVGGDKLARAIIWLIAITLGPLGAIPRTGATSAEVVIASGINISYYLFVIVFFGLSLVVILKANNVVDIIGKYLTPILLVVLIVMIIAGVVNPIGEIGASDISRSHTFTHSAIEGYNTMDALSAIAFAPIIIHSLIKKGYSDDLLEKTIKVTLVATIGLGLVYLALTYLGASASIRHANINSRTGLLVAIAESIMGSFGKYILTAIIVLACFTTSVGLISSISDMIDKITSDKYSYRFIAITIAIISMILSLVGVDQFVNLTSPLLSFAYPIVLVMICFNLTNIKTRQKPRIFTFSIIGIISLYQAIIAYVAMVSESVALRISKLISWMPLYEMGFPWLIFFIIMFIYCIIDAQDKFYTK